MILISSKLIILLIFAIFTIAAGQNSNSGGCRMEVKKLSPLQARGEDNLEYTVINLEGYNQEYAVKICLPNQSCEKGTCQQDYRLHQLMTVPRGKDKFELNELQYRQFKVPNGCICSP